MPESIERQHLDVEGLQTYSNHQAIHNQHRGAMATATGNTGWAQLRQQARSLETQVRNSSAQNVIQASLTSGLHRQRRYSTPTLSSRRYPTFRQSPQKKKGPQKRSSKIFSKKYAQALVRKTSALTFFAALNVRTNMAAKPSARERHFAIIPPPRFGSYSHIIRSETEQPGPSP